MFYNSQNYYSQNYAGILGSGLIASHMTDQINCASIVAGADPGGSLGSRDPPPEIYQRSQKSDVFSWYKTH